MNSPAPISRLRVASPCLARWSDMSGDERVRFCGQCRKHVYNLSSMTSDEASALIREKEGHLCVRFYQRSDGSVLTADCPVGADRARRRTRRWAVATALGLFLGGSLFALGSGGNAGAGSGRNRLAQAWDEAVWKVKGWLGIQPPVVMGKMCVIPTPAPTPPPAPPAPPSE